MLFFAYRGYSRGLFITLLGIIGVFASYIIGFLWGGSVASLISRAGVSSNVSFFLAYPILFFIVMTLVMSTPKLFPKNFSFIQGYKIEGAVAGLLIGLVIGLFCVWLLSIVQTFLSDNKSEYSKPLKPLGIADSNIASREVEKEDLVESVAKRFVGNTIAFTLKATGASTTIPAETVVSAVKQPKKTFDALGSLFQSEELAIFWSSASAQQLMATDNFEALVDAPEFTTLVNMPEFRHLVEPYLTRDTQGLENSGEIFVASQLAQVWKKMQRLQHDQRVRSIIDDPEIKALAAEGSPAKLFTNTKVQSLIKIISSDDTDTQNVDYTQFVKPLDDLPVMSKIEPIREDIRVYKWVNDQGVVQYTEAEDIPLNKRDSAVEIR